jgi:nucleoside-diphosphate-sugar epimerase
VKILVLGSEGQIGQYIRDIEGHEIVRSDIMLGSEHDLRFPFNSYVYRRITEADFVIFLAFDVGGSTYLSRKQHSFQYVDDNMAILKNTFQMLERSGKPFIYVSSQMSNMLDSPYGVMKRIGEFYTRALGGVIVRLWNVYGKERQPDKFHAITDFINSAREWGEVRMQTNGLEERQFLWAEDCVEALVTLAERYDELDRSEYYDVTSFQWITIGLLATLVAEAVGNTDIVVGDKKDMTQTVKNEPAGSILQYWAPRTSLHNGIRMLME